jgi:hypothetical protein
MTNYVHHHKKECLKVINALKTTLLRIGDHGHKDIFERQMDVDQAIDLVTQLAREFDEDI